MENTQPTNGSKWHKPVPKAVSNAAMVAMVTLCYFGLVSPTLELVQTASLVQANTMLRYNSDFGVQVTTPDDKAGISALRELAILTVNTTTNQEASVALVKNNIGDPQLSYVNISPVNSIQVLGPNGDPFTAGQNSIIENTLISVSPTAYKPAALNPGNPGVDNSTVIPVATSLSEEVVADRKAKVDELKGLVEVGQNMLAGKLTPEQLNIVVLDLNELLTEIGELLEGLEPTYVSAPAARPGEGESPVSVPPSMLYAPIPPVTNPLGGSTSTTGSSAPPTHGAATKIDVNILDY